MKLLVEMIAGSEVGAVRLIDGSVPFVIGTDPDALWRIPPPDTAARLELRRNENGFNIVAEGDVSVDGQSINDGAERTVHHGVSVKIAGSVLLIRIQQDQVADVRVDMFEGPATTTISAILSDVAPGGENANGILPGHGGEDWLTSVIGTNEARNATPEPAWDTDTYDGVRRAEFAQPKLPEDWAGNSSESANRFEQSGADRQGLALTSDSYDDVNTSQQAGVDTVLLRRAAGLLEGEIDASEAAQLQNAGEALKAMLEQMAELQRALDVMLSDLGARRAPNDHTRQKAFHSGKVLGDDTGLSVAALAQQLKTMRLEYGAVFATLSETLAKSRETLDVDSILASVSANYGPAARLQPARTGWKEYCRRWTDDANPLGADYLTAELQNRLDDLREEFDR